MDLKTPLIKVTTDNQLSLQSLIPSISHDCTENLDSIIENYENLENDTSNHIEILEIIEKRFILPRTKNNRVQDFCKTKDIHHLCSSQKLNKNKTIYALEVQKVKDQIETNQQDVLNKTYNIIHTIAEFFNEKNQSLELDTRLLADIDITSLEALTISKLNKSDEKFTVLPIKIIQLDENTDYHNLKVGIEFPFQNMESPLNIDTDDLLSETQITETEIFDFEGYQAYLIQFSTIEDRFLSLNENEIISQEQDFSLINAKKKLGSEEHLVFVNRKTHRTIYLDKNNEDWGFIEVEIEKRDDFVFQTNTFTSCIDVFKNEYYYLNQYVQNSDEITDYFKSKLARIF